MFTRRQYDILPTKGANQATPTASKAWSGFNMSQSPPSHSPIRRALGGSPSEGSEAGEEYDNGQESAVRAILKEEPDTQGYGAADDDDTDSGQEDQPFAGHVPMAAAAGVPVATSVRAPAGVQVLSRAPCATQDSADEEDEDESEAGDEPPAVQAVGSHSMYGQAANSTEVVGSHSMYSQAVGSHSMYNQAANPTEALPMAVEEQIAETAPDDEEEDEEEEEEAKQEDQQEENSNDDEVVPPNIPVKEDLSVEIAQTRMPVKEDLSEEIAQTSMLVKEMKEDPDDERGCQDVKQSQDQLVAARGSGVDNQDQIVAAQFMDGAASWGTSLPPEATDKWTTLGDICSLQVGGAEMKLPRSVYERLYGYQREGVVWMWNLFRKGFGGILADEMGLGKTVQTAAFLACLKFTEQGSRFLVIVNVTILDQWMRELGTWAQDTGLAVHVLHGAQHDRRRALRGMAARGGVLLCTYDGVRIAINHLRTAGLCNAAAAFPKKRKRTQLSRGRACRDDDSPSEEEAYAPPEGQEPLDPDMPWDVVVVDEAHQIKNPFCITGRELRRVVSRSRFLLTGTPLQNKLSDLWALMDFAQPGLLGNHATFERSFSEQIAKGSKRNASRFAVELKDHLARELKRLTSPHFLRRMKTEVVLGTGTEKTSEVPQDLPPKTDVVLWLGLTPAQLELYNLYLGTEMIRRATGEKIGMEALRAIALLKKLCNHPLLCLPAEEFTQWKSQCAPSANAIAEGSVPSGVSAAPDLSGASQDLATQPAVETQEVLPRLRALVPSSVQGAALLSCKLRVLSVLLPQLQKRGHRCLIFSQSTKMLDLIQSCVLRPLGLKFLRIDGNVDARDRDLKVQKFQQPNSRYSCLCLSVQVGGTGLTITSADRVILVDPAWNPSMDAQAIDRVHRIGQERPVVVYRLIGAGAIEDKMFRLQVFKRGLSKTYLEQEQQVRFFSHKELKQLFEPPSTSQSTQSLMAEKIGTEALEHEELLSVVAGDVGTPDDPQALPFWQSSDVVGFSDYQRLFMFLEQANQSEEVEVAQKARAATARLRSEEYLKDQVMDGKTRIRELKENVSPQQAEAKVELPPLQDA
mmetsp:Transcript_87644/g.173938  ORF Transcript_87644/g.173938 Transcript_87644/m.173938 type:complete len:1086 (-) Transcript_87644:145-3402(-)